MDTCAPPRGPELAAAGSARARGEGQAGGRARRRVEAGTWASVRGAGARTRAAHLLAGAQPRPPSARGAGRRCPGGDRARRGPGAAVAVAARPGRTMAELLRSLQDAQLVARFQRRCGLFPAPEEGPGENGAGPAEGAAPAPGVAHRSAANGKGGGGPANGLLRVRVPQVTVGRCAWVWRGRGCPWPWPGRAPRPRAESAPAPGTRRRAAAGGGASGRRDAAAADFGCWGPRCARWRLSSQMCKLRD